VAFRHGELNSPPLPGGIVSGLLYNMKRKLSDEQIVEAAHLYEQGYSLSQLASMFSVSFATIRLNLIENGVKMRSLPEAAKLNWQREGYRNEISRDKTTVHRAKLSVSMQQTRKWKREHPDTSDTGTRTAHGIKMSQTAWDMVKRMAQKRNLPIGEYVRRLVEADERNQNDQ
jgi:transposase